MSEILHLLRITIEAKTPLSLGSGDVVLRMRKSRDDPGKDEEIRAAALMRDANGLPVIPGPSVRGVLRSLLTSVEGAEIARDRFGFAEGDEGQAGRVVTGFGSVHGKDDNAIDGLSLDEREDDLLEALGKPSPVWRDHVSLNGRHVVGGRKKFARAAVPAGTRFSFEFSQWAEAAAGKESLVGIARLFLHPWFRLGGSTRRGYGQVDLIRASYAAPDLDNSKALRAIRVEPPSTGLTENLLATSKAKIDEPFPGILTVKGILTPLNPWRIGGQSPSMTADTQGIRQADGHPTSFPNADPRAETDILTIAREPVIRWTGQNGMETGALVKPCETGPFRFPVPGSAVKGPLAHRALYHWNRALPGGQGMIDAEAWLKLPEVERTAQLKEFEKLQDRREAKAPRDQQAGQAPCVSATLGALLGEAKAPDDSQAGRAARVVFPDLAVAGVTQVLAIDHNSIDRFTGGVRNKALFSEEVLVGGEVHFEMLLLPPLGKTEGGVGGWPKNVARAFLAALADLCRGRLAIGARSLGFCEGALTFEGDGAEAWRNCAKSVGVPLMAQAGAA